MHKLKSPGLIWHWQNRLRGYKALLNSLTKGNVLAAQPSQCWAAGFILTADTSTPREKGQADGHSNLLYLCIWSAQNTADRAVIPSQAKHMLLSKGEQEQTS